MKKKVMGVVVEYTEAGGTKHTRKMTMLNWLIESLSLVKAIADGRVMEITVMLALVDSEI